ncbi:MAG: BlaB/IND/MUS family subclass B1 metallo-beta-lactamase [Bacteroidetes bacterium]|nr:BlaB/IND/MUS family subclass B1 metallo-beta-lactamase [Bacteroidota bacterium]
MRFLFIILFFFQILHLKAQVEHNDIRFTHLTGDFYIYTTFNLYKGEKIPANGMYLVTGEGVVLFDTPWDTSQFQPLLDSIQLRHNKKVMICIATHFHDDRSAGLEYYRSKAIKTYTSLLTDELSKKNNKKRAEFLLTKDTVFHVGNYSFETFYPGPGHTQDNIVIWFEKEKILYGACLIKSAEDEDLGYLGDADTKEYANTIHKLQQKCGEPKYIIVGHGDWTNLRSLEHTYEMAKALRKKIGG